MYRRTYNRGIFRLLTIHYRLAKYLVDDFVDIFVKCSAHWWDDIVAAHLDRCIFLPTLMSTKEVQEVPDHPATLELYVTSKNNF